MLTGQWGRLMMLVARDAASIGFTLWVWQLPAVQGGAWLMSAIAALLVTLCGYLLHEWGHLLGALAWRCRFELPRRPFESPFLFRFERDGNTRPQFFAMALGGFVASTLTVIFLALTLPWTLLASQIALTLTAVGVLATLVIEVPEFLRVWNGAPIPNGAAFVSADKPR